MVKLLRCYCKSGFDQSILEKSIMNTVLYVYTWVGVFFRV